MFLYFTEQDLVEEDVMILDTFSELFVWVGRGANEVEKKEALKTAQEYIKTDPSDRDLDSTTLIQVHSIWLIEFFSTNCKSFPFPQVKQGCEPPTFTCHFLGWNPNLWAQDKSYETYRQQLSVGVTTVAEELEKYDESRKFKYEELKGKEHCPTGVDASKKEVS